LSAPAREFGWSDSKQYQAKRRKERYCRDPFEIQQAAVKHGGFETEVRHKMTIETGLNSLIEGWGK
jgi:hypothetical protein